MTSRHIRFAAIAVALFALAAAPARAGQASKVDVTGTWVFEVQTDAGPGTPTIVFKQDGEKLTGHYSSSTLGEAELTGSIKGSELTFSFTAEVQGASIPVTYTATVDSASSMKGRIVLAGVGSGTFTGKKK